MRADTLSGPEAETTRETVSSEGADNSVTGVCTDLAGNRASDSQAAIKLDKTPPAADPAVRGSRAAADGTSAPYSVLWGWTDALSGPFGEGCDDDGKVEHEGAGQVLDSQCGDVAGNVATASRTFDVDLTDPEISAMVDHAPGSSGWHTAPVTIQYECADPGEGSGLEPGACPDDVTVGEEGVTTITRSVSDRAGRESLVTTTVKVDLNDPTLTGPPPAPTTSGVGTRRPSPSRSPAATLSPAPASLTALRRSR